MLDHHAYLLVGERGEVEAELARLLTGASFVITGNPDFFAYESDTFTVDDARELGDKARTKAFGERKVFVLRSERYSQEAQNALLKTLEEPVANTHFFILARDVANFLPTIISRVRVVRVEGGAEDTKNVSKFLSATPAKRLDFAKKFDDRAKLAEFLDSLLVELKGQKVGLDVLKRVLTVREFASDPAVMPRLVLEHLAFIV